MFSILLSALFLMAEAGGEGGGAPAGPAGGLLSSPLLPMMAIFFLFMYFFMIRPQRQEQNRRQTMLAGLKKNDRVVTAGGIYGVIANIHREADEVTLKVDEATNTKLRVTLGSITQVLGDEPSEDTASK